MSLYFFLLLFISLVFLSLTFFLTIYANFRIFLKIIPLGRFNRRIILLILLILLVAFRLLKLIRFRYLSFLRQFFCLQNKVVLFIFIGVNDSLNAVVLSSFLAKLILFCILSYLFQFSTA